MNVSLTYSYDKVDTKYLNRKHCFSRSNYLQILALDQGQGGARADWLCTAVSSQGGGGVGCCVRSVQQLTETGRERQL